MRSLNPPRSPAYSFGPAWLSPVELSLVVPADKRSGRCAVSAEQLLALTITGSGRSRRPLWHHTSGLFAANDEALRLTFLDGNMLSVFRRLQSLGGFLQLSA